MEQLAHYPERFASPPLLAELAAGFGDRLERIVPRLADMVARRQPEALAIRSQRWSASADDLRCLEESLRQFPDAIAQCGGPDDREDLCDRVVQSLDFILRTAANAARKRDQRDLEIAIALTSNHSNAQQSIRATFESRDGAGERQDSRLDLISLYFRCVYFLHRFAERALEDLSSGAAEAAVER